jgi:drug/metabolite transporter (DMT)-like permease
MKDHQKAILFMLLSALSFTVMGYFVKSLPEVPFSFKVLFRNLVVFFMVGIPTAIQVLRGRSVEAFLGAQKSRGALFLRSLLGFFGVIFLFLAIDGLQFFWNGESIDLVGLSLAEASSLNRTSPLFVLIFASLFIGEKVKAYQIPLTILGFAGALLIIKPEFSPQILPALFGMASGAFAGGAYTLIRGLKGKSSPTTIVLWFSGFSVLGILPLCIADWSSMTWEPLTILVLAGIGLSAGLGQIFLTQAYHLEKASEVSVYNYSHVLFSLLIDFLVFQALPDLWSILGALVIAGAGVGMFLMRGRRIKESAG